MEEKDALLPLLPAAGAVGARATPPPPSLSLWVWLADGTFTSFRLPNRSLNEAGGISAVLPRHRDAANICARAGSMS